MHLLQRANTFWSEKMMKQQDRKTKPGHRFSLLCFLEKGKKRLIIFSTIPAEAATLLFFFFFLLYVERKILPRCWDD